RPMMVCAMLGLLPWSDPVRDLRLLGLEVNQRAGRGIDHGGHLALGLAPDALAPFATVGVDVAASALAAAAHALAPPVGAARLDADHLGVGAELLVDDLLLED